MESYMEKNSYMKKEKHQVVGNYVQKNLTFLFFSKKRNLGRLSWFNFLREICEMDEGNILLDMDQ